MPNSTPTTELVRDRLRAVAEDRRERSEALRLRQQEEVSRWEWHLHGHVYIGSRPLSSGERIRLGVHLWLTRLTQLIMLWAAWALLELTYGHQTVIGPILVIVFGLIAPVLYLQQAYVRPYRDSLAMGRALRFAGRNQLKEKWREDAPRIAERVTSGLMSAPNNNRRFLEITGVEGFVLRSRDKWNLDLMVTTKEHPSKLASRGEGLELTPLEREEIDRRYKSLRSRWVTRALMVPLTVFFLAGAVASIIGCIFVLIYSKELSQKAVSIYEDFRLMRKLKSDRHAQALTRKGASLYLPSGTLWWNGKTQAKWRILDGSYHESM